MTEKDNYTIKCLKCNNRKLVHKKHKDIGNWICSDCKKKKTKIER